MTSARRAPVSAVVLTFNEERNLERSLATIAPWVQQLFVVDSGSTDRTVEIARQCGAVVVTHAFVSHTLQWRWALTTLPLTSPWVLGLDADQRVTPELRASIEAAIASAHPDGPRGYYLRRRLIFRGRWLRHGGLYPKYLLKLFRREFVRLDEQDHVDHHFTVDGPVGRLSGDLIEDNQNELRIADWVSKHNRYATRQASEEIADTGDPARAGRLFGHPDERVRWLKRRWAGLPLYVRPWIYFLYRYVLRLGLLDGRQGFAFHFMQALWYRTLVDINREELSAGQPAPVSVRVPADGIGPPPAGPPRAERAGE